jgi:hypothetical protein
MKSKIPETRELYKEEGFILAHDSGGARLKVHLVMAFLLIGPEMTQDIMWPDTEFVSLLSLMKPPEFNHKGSIFH